MDFLWSASTSMRSPERTFGFLKTISEIDGCEWNKETQMRLQSLLIKNRYYVPSSKGLKAELLKKLDNLEYNLSYEEAREIFDAKNYKDPPMRGRTSFDPIEKMGLVQLDYKEYNGKRKQVVRVTKLGWDFLNSKIKLNDLVFSYLLKFQYPNPLFDNCPGYNTKPFINTLRLIKTVNELCVEQKMKPKGISFDEFGIFVLSIKSFTEVKKKAKDLLEFRKTYDAIGNYSDKRNFRDNYVKSYLPTFKEAVNNTKEYADNIIRYLRLTNYVYLRGGNRYVDLEPRREIEINALLANDDGSAKHFTEEEYKEYISDYNAYILPFETKESLNQIVESIVNEIHNIQSKLEVEKTSFIIASDVDELKQQIVLLREERSKLQNLELKEEYQPIDKIEETINALKNINNLGIKPSIALEKWANISLNIIDDAIMIKPNSPMGDDNEPTFTAPPGVPDIECFYKGFGLICEVTMLRSRDQWFNEGQPVMRHLRDFEDNSNLNSYCLFVAPKLHQDTINTFWNAVKYEYQGKKQKIIPLTISQLIEILEGIKSAKINNKKITNEEMEKLYSNCSNVSSLQNSLEWQGYVNKQIYIWKNEIAI